VLDVASTTSAGIVVRFTNATGSCTINPTTTSLSCSSDERLKKNIVSVSDARSATSSLAQVMLLDPVMYNWTREATSSPKHAGFIAQKVEKIFPDLVSQDDNGYYAVNYGGFAPYLTAAIQEIGHVTGTFKDALIAWLADAANGVHDLYASVFHAQEVQTQRLCVGNICVTQEQFLAMAKAAGISPDGAAEGTPSTDVQTPPPSGDSQATSTATSTPSGAGEGSGEEATSTPSVVIEQPPAQAATSTPPVSDPAPEPAQEETVQQPSADVTASSTPQ
jgi:hypothetical protein